MAGKILQLPRTKDRREFDGMGIEIDVEEHRKSRGAMFTSARFALRFCNFDNVEGERAVRRCLDDGDIYLFDKMSADWEDDIERLEALIAVMEAARARLAISKAKTRKVENAIWKFDMNEYNVLKAQNPIAILFYRMANFYELFFDDAEIAACALGIVLTKRGGGEPVPMCRVPVERAEDYLNRLIGEGYSVAFCELIRNLDGSYRREVARLAWPGVSPACDDGQSIAL